MIIERLTLHPFAGGLDRSVRFVPGLNVVVGPNEAGKSTLSAALKQVLFSRGPITQTRFRTELQTFLPASGGDTLRVSLAFLADNTRYELERVWVAPKNVASRLRRSEGGEIADHDAIQKIVDISLGVTEGTYDNVLCVTQASLSQTIRRLAEESKGSSGRFADVLRKSLYESDGISIDALDKTLNARIAEYFGRWDRVKNAPEKGLGIDNPWEKGNGIIVNAYYAFARAARDLAEAETYERKLDEFVAQERTLGETCRTIARFVEENSPSVEDVRRRAELARTLKDKQDEAKSLRVVLDQWPRAEEQLAATTQSIRTLRDRYANLQRELEAARERLRQQSLRDAFQKAEILHRRMMEEEQLLAGLPLVTEEQIEHLRKEESAFQQVEIKIAARSLAMHLTAVAPVNIRVRHDSEDTHVQLDAGQEFTSTSAGKLSLAHPDWNLEVWSTGAELDVLERQRAQIVERRAALLASTKAKDAEMARSMRRSYVDQSARVEKVRAGLSAILGSESFASLSQLVTALRPIEAGRTQEEITEDLLAVRGEGVEMHDKEVSLKNQCERWTQEFSDTDALLRRFTSCIAEENNAKEALDRSKPVPAGYPDAESFIAAFEDARSRTITGQNSLSEVQKGRLIIEKNAPQQSRKDLDESVKTLKESFGRALAHGNAFASIREELNRLLQGLDNNLFIPYQDRVRELMSALTLHRHESLQMKGSLPDRIDEKGGELSLNQLSLGTLDVLGVAVRIAMAEYHLRPNDGFILLDDPLVNLDPDRQSAAAQCLREFATKHQTIVLTCHPAHADVLGGEQIELR